MGLIKKINSQRISWCCHEYGISVPVLGKKIGMAPSRLDAVLGNNAGMTAKQLRSLAKLFHKDVSFFMEPGPVDEKKVLSVNFRTIAGQRPGLDFKIKTLIERVELHRKTYVDLKEDSIEPLETPWKGMGNFPQGRSPASVASFTRDWLGLDAKDRDFPTFRQAVEDKGILVFVSNGYAGKWQIEKDSPMRGFSLYFDLAPVIFIKKISGDAANDGGKRIQTFTLMHELGHLLIHKNSFIDFEEDIQKHKGIEKEANEIAGNILVPAKYLHQLDLDKLSDADATEFDDLIKAKANSWGVNSWVVMLRLLAEGRISKTQYNAYEEYRMGMPKSITNSNDGFGRRTRHQEPLNIFGRHYVATVLDALNEKQITLVKASNFLDNLSVRDLHELNHAF